MGTALRCSNSLGESRFALLARAPAWGGTAGDHGALGVAVGGGGSTCPKESDRDWSVSVMWKPALMGSEGAVILWYNTFENLLYIVHLVFTSCLCLFSFKVCVRVPLKYFS